MYVCDHKAVPRWKRGLVEVQRKTAGPVGVGTIDIHVSQFLGRRSQVGHQITEFEPHRRVVYRTISGPFFGRGEFTFEPNGKSTQLAVVSIGEPSGIYKVLGALLVGIASRQLQRDLANLKGY